MVSIHDETHRFLSIELNHNPDGDNEDAHYLDLAYYLSQMNRRTYRQGMMYDIANITFHDSSSGEIFIKLATAPRTWALQAAWKIGFKQWIKQQRAGLDALGLKEFGPWHDFKVYLNNNMIGNTDLNPPLIDLHGDTFPTGDWDYSTYDIPQPGSTDPQSATIQLMANNAGTSPALTKISLLKQLELVLRKPTEDPALPGTASTSVWAILSGDVSDSELAEKIIESIEEENDMPPYSATDVPGSGTPGSGKPAWPWVIREACIQGGAHHMVATGPMSIPCGLLMINTENATDDNKIGVTIEMMPGDYKGVSARPMNGGGR